MSWLKPSKRKVPEPPAVFPPMNCVILQPSYIPWRGYFHQVQKADVFVFYDDLQYDERGWRNRNQIKGPQGLQWLTVPVLTIGARTEQRTIKEIKIVPNDRWREKHWRAIHHNYHAAPFYETYRAELEKFYQRDYEFLADFTIDLTVHLARLLGLQTRFLRSSTLPSQGRKTDRLLGILHHLGATHYITGPAAKAYLEEDKLAQHNISLEYMSYQYPVYP